DSRDRTRRVYGLEDNLRLQPNEEIRIILYRVAQEALTNIRKHAQAEEAAVLLAQQDGCFVGRIADDGVGFSPQETLPMPGHLGLAAMRERAELAGGAIR